jgi:hypothetical protein
MKLVVSLIFGFALWLTGLEISQAQVVSASPCVIPNQTAIVNGQSLQAAPVLNGLNFSAACSNYGDLASDGPLFPTTVTHSGFNYTIPANVWVIKGARTYAAVYNGTTTSSSTYYVWLDYYSTYRTTTTNAAPTTASVLIYTIVSNGSGITTVTPLVRSMFTVPQQGIYNVVSYGADPTGTNNSTSAFQSAATACAANSNGGIIYAPSGTYLITSAISITSSSSGSCSLQGTGSGFQGNTTGTFINANYAGDVFDINFQYGGGLDVHGMYIERTQSQSSGAIFNCQFCSNVHFHDIGTHWAYDAFQVGSTTNSSGGNGISIDNIYMQSTTHNAVHVVGTVGNLNMSNDYMGGDYSVAYPAGANTMLNIDFASATYTPTLSPWVIKNVDVEGFSACIYGSITAGLIADGEISNMFCDGPDANGIKLQARSSSAQIQELRIHDNFVTVNEVPSTATTVIPALYLDGGGSGQASGFLIADNFFEGAQGSSPRLSPGIELAGGNSDVTITGNRIYNNNYGVYITGAAGFTNQINIANNDLGQYQYNTNHTYYGTNNNVGVEIKPLAGSLAVEAVTITGNDLSSNATNAVTLDSSLGGTINYVSLVGNQMTHYSTHSAISIVGSNTTNTETQNNIGYCALSPTDSPLDGCFAGTVYAAAVTDSGLTSGNCVQAGTGGILTTTSSACGSSGGGITGLTAGNDIAVGSGSTPSVAVTNAPTFTGGVAAASFNASSTNVTQGFHNAGTLTSGTSCGVALGAPIGSGTGYSCISTSSSATVATVVAKVLGLGPNASTYYAFDQNGNLGLQNNLFANGATLSGLTGGNCIQAGTGGLLATISTPCGTLTSLTAGNDIAVGTGTTPTVSVTNSPTFTGQVNGGVFAANSSGITGVPFSDGTAGTAAGDVLVYGNGNTTGKTKVGTTSSSINGITGDVLGVTSVTGVTTVVANLDHVGNFSVTGNVYGSQFQDEGAAATSTLCTDSLKSLSSVCSGVSATYNSVAAGTFNDTGLTATTNVCTDSSKNLTSTCSGVGVTFSAVTAGTMTDSGLTSGQCVQAGTGGLLATTGSACGSGGGGVSSIVAGTNISTSGSTTVTVNVINSPVFSGVIGAAGLQLGGTTISAGVIEYGTRGTASGDVLVYANGQSTGMTREGTTTNTVNAIAGEIWGLSMTTTGTTQLATMDHNGNFSVLGELYAANINDAGLSATSTVCSDASGNLTSGCGSANPSYGSTSVTGLTDSGLTATTTVCTNGSKLLTSTCTSTTPSFGSTTASQVIDSGLTATTCVSANGSKQLTSAAANCRQFPYTSFTTFANTALTASTSTQLGSTITPALGVSNGPNGNWLVTVTLDFIATAAANGPCAITSSSAGTVLFTTYYIATGIHSASITNDLADAFMTSGTNSANATARYVATYSNSTSPAFSAYCYTTTASKVVSGSMGVVAEPN